MSSLLTIFSFGGAQCALTAVIALKTQKNEKKFLKKFKFETVTTRLYKSEEGWESKGSDEACGLIFRVDQFCFGDFVLIPYFPP